MKMRRPADSGAAPDSLPYAQVERVFGGRFGVAIGQRYEAILDAGRETIARRGYHLASIREIARAADLSLAGLYHYVGGKDELLFLVLDHDLDLLLRAQAAALAAARTPEGMLLALVRTHLDRAEQVLARVSPEKRNLDQWPELDRARLGLHGEVRLALLCKRTYEENLAPTLARLGIG